MARALEQARAAAVVGEVPVGAVLVRDGRLVAEGHNLTVRAGDPTGHAEVVTLRRAGVRLGGWRLLDTTLYVTLEPCAMCVGALIHARVERLVFGASDPKSGATGGAFDLVGRPEHNHRIAVTGGVLGDDCGDLLRDFFRARR